MAKSLWPGPLRPFSLPKLEPHRFPQCPTVIGNFINDCFAGLVSMTVAILLERIAYRPLRGSPRLVPLITAIGVFFLSSIYVSRSLRFGIQSLPRREGAARRNQHRRHQHSSRAGLCLCSALVLMLCLYWLVERSRVGKAMRAVSENKEVARLMGIDIDWVIMFTFGVGGFLGRVAGVITACSARRASTFIWVSYLASKPSQRRTWRNRQHTGRDAGRPVSGCD